MKIGFIGLGKLGLPTAVTLAEVGHDVMGFDLNPYRMTKQPVPEREAGLKDGLTLNDYLAKSALTFGALPEVCAHADILFVTIETPHAPQFEGCTPLGAGRADFDYEPLKTGMRMVARAIRKPTVVAIVSTVLPGTTRREIMPLVAGNPNIGLAYNPSFIAMGTVMRDFMAPEFVLLGADDPGVATVMTRFYEDTVRAPVRAMSIESAELAKVAYNTFISLKIAFANSLMEICEHFPAADVDDVTDAIKAAGKRLISPAYLSAGMGDGGGCLPAGGIVLTEDGPRAIESVRAGDRVLARDGRLHRVVKRWERDYEGTLVEVRVEGQPPALFTADHPMLAAADGRHLCPNGRRNTRLAAAEVLGAEIERDAAQLQLGDFLPTAAPVAESQADLPAHVTPDYCELAGWYLSEGSVESRPRRSGRVSFALHADERATAERLCRLLVAVSPPKTAGRGRGAVPRIVQRKPKCIAVRYGSLALAEQLLADFGKGAAEKRIPAWAVYGPPWAGEALLKGVWQGDGHSSRFGMALSTISADIAYQMQALLQRFGVPTTLRDIAPRRGADGQRHRRAYEVRVRNARFYSRLAALTGLPRPPERPQKLYTRFPERDGALYRKIIGLDRRPWSGRVYNLWVEGDHTFATPIGAVHNCHPRDNIAMSWLDREIGLSHSLFDDAMRCRELQAEWLAQMMIEYAGRSSPPLPCAIVGYAFKAGTNITTGSPALLVANLLARRGVRAKLIDHHVDRGKKEFLGGPHVVLIGCRHPETPDGYRFSPGSVVIDPFRYMPDQEGVETRRLGAGRGVRTIHVKQESAAAPEEPELSAQSGK